MSAEETKHKKGRIAEENTDKETMGADDGMMKTGLPFSEPSSPAVRCRLRVCNEHARGSLKVRTQTLDQVMEALADPNTHIIGIHCSNENTIRATATTLETITRRAQRDNMFDVILKATITKKPDIKKIQSEIADGLNLKLDEKSVSKRASILHDCIKMKQKILVMLSEVYKGIDLGKVGIPYRADHSGCKILLTSTSEDVLSNQMHTQKNISA